MDVRIHIHYFCSIPSPWSKQLKDATGTGTLSSLDAHVAQHQLGASLVVELRGDVEALGLGEHVTG